MLDFAQLSVQCAPLVSEVTLAHLVRVESSFNPYAIGIVGGRLTRQPRSLDEAQLTAAWLTRHQINYSAGLAQVNQANFARFGLTVRSAFEACPNLAAGAALLEECYLRAYQAHQQSQRALHDALSCYNSGNFKTGYRTGYVAQVIADPILPTPAPKSAAGQGREARDSSSSARVF